MLALIQRIVDFYLQESLKTPSMMYPTKSLFWKILLKIRMAVLRTSVYGRF